MAYGLCREYVAEEFQNYKAQALKQTPEQIWNKCVEIYFYCCMYEYFMYNEEIPYMEEIKKADKRNIIAGCWKLYLKHENLSVKSWADINELIIKYLGMGE